MATNTELIQLTSRMMRPPILKKSSNMAKLVMVITDPAVTACTGDTMPSRLPIAISCGKESLKI